MLKRLLLFLFTAFFLFPISATAQISLSGLVIARNDKKLIEGASVTVQEFTTNPIEMRDLPIQTVKTDANGVWSATDLKPKRYRIKIEPPPHMRSLRAGQRALSSVSQIVEIPPTGKRDHIIELPLESTISGNVRDPDGKPVELDFFVIATDEALGIVSGNPVEGGKFNIRNLSQGNYQFNLTEEDGYYLERVIVGDRDLPAVSSVEVGDGVDLSNVTLVVSNITGTVTGRVVGLEDGDFRLVVLIPYHETAASALRASNPEATDEDGEFEISARPGEYYLAAIDGPTLQKRTPENAEEWLREIVKRAQSIVISAGQTTNVELRPQH